MSIVEEIEGRRIAKDVEARAKALGVLNRSKSKMPQWLNLVFIIASGVGLGALGALGAAGILGIGIVAGLGYFFGLTSFFEVMRLRRRLDAMTTLLRLSQCLPTE
ncbi:hypothetical protein [Metallibacterium sp.]